MTDPNFKSTLYLNNMLREDSLTVTPLLHLSNGVGYFLPAVTLEPSGTAAININQALASQGVAPYATLSGYVEVQYQWGWAAICGGVWNVDTLHSLIFVYPLVPPPAVSPPGNGQGGAVGQGTQLLEGMWWKQEGNVTGFVALSNVTARPITATVQVLDAGNQVLGQHSVTVASQGTKIVDLGEILTAGVAVGGVLVTWNGEQGELVANAGLKDEAVGYSARLPLGMRPANDAQASEDNFSELGLMSGAADPMMNFPGGTVFTPYSVVRNLSEQPVTVAPTLWWMADGAAQSAQASAFTLAPHQTMKLDMLALMAVAGLKNYNGSVNVVLDAKGQQGALLLASGSVDQSYTYVFEALPRGVRESAAKGLQYWSTGNGDDTMVTVWNPADEAQDFVFTLYYTGGHYLYPIHLEARATHSFNVSEITRSAVPDSEGNVIPAGVWAGSAKISGSQAENQAILVVIDAGIYNARKATCSAPPCQPCDGFTSIAIADNPFAVAVGGTKQQIAKAQWSTGTSYDYTSQSNWSSSNTSVATVNSGLVSGVSVGSLTLSATFAPIPPSMTACPPQNCEAPVMPTASGGGDVTGLTCSPSSVTRGSSTTCTVNNPPSGATFSNWQFKDSNGHTVSGSGTSSSWSGIMVTGGTVSVTVSGGGSNANPTASIGVTARTNFAFTAVSPNSEPNNSSPSPTCTLSVPSPPMPNSNLGLSCLEMDYHENDTTVSDSGPNQGYHYVTSVSSSNQGTSTAYYYVISPDLTNTSSAFYLAQTGTYNAQTNPNGFISGANLLTDTTRHESGTVNAHYENYVVAQNNPTNNLGVVAEAETGPPSQSTSDFQTQIKTDLTNAATSIKNAMSVQPCGQPYTGYDATCTFQGYVNYNF